MELDTTKYKHTHQWFVGSEIQKHLLKFIDPKQKITMLEIGSYEGLSACCFLDNIMYHDDSTLDCVDPFDISDTTSPLTNVTESNCRYNISHSINSTKCSIYKMYSSDFFPIAKKIYDIIYIDGSHLPDDIKYDMRKADRCLKVGGIMWMDDYLGGTDGSIRKAMNEVVMEFGTRYKTIHYGYQLALQKVA